MTNFNAGDKVTYTNDYGVAFEGKTVTGFDTDGPLAKYGKTVLIDTDCHWMPVHPYSLTKEDN